MEKDECLNARRRVPALSLPGGADAAVPQRPAGPLRGSAVHHLPLHHGPRVPGPAARRHRSARSAHGESAGRYVPSDGPAS